MNRLESIKELRSKISPTPWKYEFEMQYDGMELKQRWVGGPALNSNYTDDTPEGKTANADCEFVANSPIIVDYLLQRLKRYEKALKGVIEQSNSNNCNWCGDTVKVIAEEALKDEIT